MTDVALQSHVACKAVLVTVIPTLCITAVLLASIAGHHPLPAPLEAELTKALIGDISTAPGRRLLSPPDHERSGEDFLRAFQGRKLLAKDGWLKSAIVKYQQKKRKKKAENPLVGAQLTDSSLLWSNYRAQQTRPWSKHAQAFLRKYHPNLLGPDESLLNDVLDERADETGEPTGMKRTTPLAHPARVYHERPPTPKPTRTPTPPTAKPISRNARDKPTENLNTLRSREFRARQKLRLAADPIAAKKVIEKRRADEARQYSQRKERGWKRSQQEYQKEYQKEYQAVKQATNAEASKAFVAQLPQQLPTIHMPLWTFIRPEDLAHLISKFPRVLATHTLKQLFEMYKEIGGLLYIGTTKFVDPYQECPRYLTERGDGKGGRNRPVQVHLDGSYVKIKEAQDEYLACVQIAKFEMYTGDDSSEDSISNRMAASRFEGVLQHALSGPVSKSPICAPRLWRKIEGGTSKLGSDGDSAIFVYLVLQRPLKCVP